MCKYSDMVGLLYLPIYFVWNIAKWALKFITMKLVWSCSKCIKKLDDYHQGNCGKYPLSSDLDVKMVLLRYAIQQPAVPDRPPSPHPAGQPSQNSMIARCTCAASSVNNLLFFPSIFRRFFKQPRTSHSIISLWVGRIMQIAIGTIGTDMRV